MRLAANLIHQDAGELAAEAERLGYGLVLAAEGYRSDAVSVLGAAAARTSRIGLASGVMQIPGRPPGMAALTAATLDAMSGGRFRLGLGVSNPHVSDGWYGVAFDHPLERTREYVEVVREALLGEPVRYQGKHFALPAHGHGQAPLHLRTEHPNPALPVYLGAVGPRALRLASEVADGWLSGFTTPALIAESVAEIGAGRARAGKSMAGFEVVPFVPASFGEDIAKAAVPLRARYAHLLGIGGATDNFYRQLATTMGFEREMAEFQDRILAKDSRGAAAAVPLEFIDRTALLGPVDRVAARMRAFAEAGVTYLSVMVSANATDRADRLVVLTQAAEALRRSGTAD